MQDLKELKSLYEHELKEKVMDFWLENGVDYEYGGYLTALDREGKVYNEDKSVWFQGRALWIYSKMINTYGENDKYRKAADCGYEFIQKLYFEDGRMPFIVNRKGEWLQKRRYYFSETFAAIALAEYATAAKKPDALILARKTYDTILKIYQGEIKTEPKFNPELVKGKAFAVPMILLNVASILRQHDSENESKYNRDIDGFLEEVKLFVHPEHKCCFESVGLNGEMLPGPKGRLVNPGHAIEGGWFVLNEAEYRQDEELKKLALNMIDWSFELGWDKENGGLVSFYDIEGRPLEQLEWDMRMWWPHNETLIAFIKAYRVTKNPAYLEKFHMVHDYTFKHFRDEEFGEWYGYLRKDGSVNSTLKGSMFKGPFHVPRCLLMVAEEIEALINEKGVSL